MSKIQATARWASAAALAASPYPGLSAAHLLAVVERESSGDPDIVSFTGYRGLMQIGRAVTKDWAAAAKVLSPWPSVMDPALNLRIGAWYLNWCRRFVGGLGVSGDPWEWTMAVYGWGPGNVRREVNAVRSEIGRAQSIGDMQIHRPEAGKPYVRPWYRASVYPREVALWQSRIGGVSTAIAAAAGATLVVAGAIIVLSAAVAWIVSR